MPNTLGKNESNTFSKQSVILEELLAACTALLFCAIAGYLFHTLGIDLDFKGFPFSK
jgi:hypothetical protein